MFTEAEACHTNSIMYFSEKKQMPRKMRTTLKCLNNVTCRIISENEEMNRQTTIQLRSWLKRSNLCIEMTG